MPEGLSKELQEAHLKKMPKGLKEKLIALAPDVRKMILQMTQEYHHKIDETYRLILGLIKAYSP